MTPCRLLAWWTRTAEQIVAWTLQHHPLTDAERAMVEARIDELMAERYPATA